MARLLLVLCLLTALFAATIANAAPIIPVTLRLFNEIQSNRTVPNPWVIRVAYPNGQSTKEREAFANAAMLIDSSVANFGIFLVDSYDKARMLETMNIRKIPTTLLTHFKASRPTGAKTALSQNVVFMQIDIPAAATRDQLVKNILSHVPTRYHHPITNRAVPAVTYALGLEDMVDRARLVFPKVAPANHDAVLNLAGGSNAMAVLYYFHLMKQNHLATHAEINSLGARMGPRLTVFATEDPDIAQRFGLNTTFSAAAFYLKDIAIDEQAAAAAAHDPFADEGGQGGAKKKKGSSLDALFPKTVRTVATADELATAGACAAFGAEHASLSPAEYQKQYEAELSRWHKDLTAHYNKSPLQKISRSSQFIKDVVQNKGSVSIIFMLREADRLFSKYHRTAIDFATFLRDQYRVAPAINTKLNPNINFQAFWIDGEVQDVASAFLSTKAVPSVAIVMPTQQGMAVKYFSFPEDEQKRRKKLGKDLEWPDPQDLMAYIASDQLTQNAPGMTLFTEDDVKFNDHINGDGPAAANAVDHNHRYLQYDRRHYLLGEEKASEFVSDLADGKITVDADHYDGHAGSSAGGKEVKKSKRSKKASAKEEERKKKLLEDLERKRKEREERTRAKEEADKKRREEQAAATKKELTRKAREEAKAAKKSGGGKRAANIEGVSVTAPPLQPNRFKKDYNAWKKQWDADIRKMGDKYVKNVKGGMRVAKGLSVPDWKKGMPQ